MALLWLWDPTVRNIKWHRRGCRLPQKRTWSSSGFLISHKPSTESRMHHLWKSYLENSGHWQRPYLLGWIHDFLYNRSQCVILDGHKSDSLPVTSVIPQGSVLGPILFLLFINDLPESIDCSVSLFADDTLLYQEVANNNDLETFQENLNSLGTWATRWGMDFNVSKSKIMIFNSNKTIPAPT